MPLMIATHGTTNPSDREIVITRVLNATRELVWQAWTDPQHVEQWWGPRHFSTKVVQQDLRPGGVWRYVMRGPDGSEHPIGGVVREIVPEQRHAVTAEFGKDFKHPTVSDLPGDIVMTTVLEDLGHQTRLTLTIEHQSSEDRRKHLEMGVVAGWNSSLDCLEDHLKATMAASTTTVRVTRSFAAPAEFVFDAWIDPDKIGKWMFGGNVRDEEVLHLHVDPRVGGSFSFLVRRQGREIDHVGTYREIDRPKRLVFTWGIAGMSVDDTDVAIEIRPAAAGSELNLEHSKVWTAYASRVNEGWTKMLEHLARIV
jgi:uncharacterized protein YndB with AHSA1/START domain